MLFGHKILKMHNLIHVYLCIFSLPFRQIEAMAHLFPRIKRKCQILNLTNLHEICFSVHLSINLITCTLLIYFILYVYFQYVYTYN